MGKLHDRIREISQRHKLSHLGSNLTSVDIIDEIYDIKLPDEKFVLSAGHAGLALYVVLEKHGYGDAEVMYMTHGTHPERCALCHIDCSTGSLGMGLPIALGMALADRDKNVYCLISDGESYEGAIWEVANVMRKYKVDNLYIYLNWNGWSAYDKTDERLRDIMVSMMPVTVRETFVEDYDLDGLSAHYVVL